MEKSYETDDDDYPLSPSGEEALLQAWESLHLSASSGYRPKSESSNSFDGEAEIFGDLEPGLGEKSRKRPRHHGPVGPVGGTHSETSEDSFWIPSDEDDFEDVGDPEEFDIDDEEFEASLSIEQRAPEYEYPLKYKMVRQPDEPAENGVDGAQPEQYWSHSFFRGPDDEKVKVYYCTTKSHSEEIAKLFLNEAVVGFDMEWKYPNKDDDFKSNASLLQMASEDKIALFHLAVHPGDTLEDVLAPSLKEIIESPDIIKCGVAILSADAGRCRKYLDMDPHGIFELSNMFKLVKYGNTEPQNVNRSLVKLATQVEEHLGLPLYKGKVRTSNWTRKLDKEQIKYAADDAYAGFVLFKVMDAKREVMRPMPPRPSFAELKLPIILPDGSSAGQKYNPKQEEKAKDDEIPRKNPDNETEDDEVFEALPLEEHQIFPVSSNTIPHRLDPLTSPSGSSVPNLVGHDVLGIHILTTLYNHRANLALERSVAPHNIIQNSVLKNIAISRPNSMEQLLSIRGIGKRKAEEYGEDWLRIVRESISEQAPDSNAETTSGVEEKDQDGPSHTLASQSEVTFTEVLSVEPRVTLLMDGQEKSRTRRVRSILNGVRAQLARKESLEPDLLVSDATLDLLATMYPCSDDSVKDIPGGAQFALVAKGHGLDLVSLLAKHEPPLGVREEVVSEVTRVELEREDEPSMHHESVVSNELLLSRTTIMRKWDV